MNKKLIKNNQELNNSLNLSSIKKIDFKNENELSFKSSEHLSKSLNSEYFDNLNSFGYGSKILKNLNETFGILYILPQCKTNCSPIFFVIA